MMHGFCVGDIVKPAKSTIGRRGLDDLGDGSWITSRRNYRMKNEVMMCIGFTVAAPNVVVHMVSSKTCEVVNYYSHEIVHLE